MVHRRSSNKRKIYEIKLKYRNPTINKSNDDPHNTKLFILVIVVIIVICLI